MRDVTFAQIRLGMDEDGNVFIERGFVDVSELRKLLAEITPTEAPLIAHLVQSTQVDMNELLEDIASNSRLDIELIDVGDR